MNWDTKTTSALGLLTLRNLQGIGIISVIALSKKFNTFEEIRFAGPSELRQVISANAVETISNVNNWEIAYRKADSTIGQANTLDVKIIAYKDENYPKPLSWISDFPPVIFVKGNLLSGPKRIACIGTREPTEFGQEVTKRLVKLLVNNKWSIVSGLAKGVDSISHEAALENGGHTIAVLANGLDNIYPKQNSELAHKIIDQGGALISEQPFGTDPSPALLVQRDRIQSGLSSAIMVMQTDIKGGTMHTVRFSLLQGRRVYVPVPTPAYEMESKSRGLLALINQNGLQLADTLGADGTFRALLINKFTNKSVARPIRGQKEYSTLISELDDLAIKMVNPSEMPHPNQISFL